MNNNNEKIADWLGITLSKWTAAILVKADWPHREKIGAGIYRLVTIDSTGKPFPVPRAAGNDSSGTLYIGKCDSISGRVNELRKTLRPEWSGRHTAGIRFNCRSALNQVFPITTLATSWILSEDSTTTEGEWIARYVAVFGEPPPLNIRKEG